MKAKRVLPSGGYLKVFAAKSNFWLRKRFAVLSTRGKFCHEMAMIETTLRRRGQGLKVKA